MASKVAGLLLALALVAGAAAYPFAAGTYPRLSRDYPFPIASRRLAATQQTLDILMIGNSFTYTEGMPAMLVNMASSDPGNPVRLRVWASTQGGANLADAWRRGDAARKLKARKFDYVALNQISTWPYRPDLVNLTGAWVDRWSRLVRQHGARPVLLETWADAADSGVYRDYLQGYDPASSQQKISRETAELARSRALPVIEAGASFARARADPASPDLFSPDRHHPSLAGAYLEAATYYRFFTGRTPDHVRYRPRGLGEADARRLRRAASQ